MVTCELHRLLIYLNFEVLIEERKLVLINLQPLNILVVFYQVLLVQLVPLDIFGILQCDRVNHLHQLVAIINVIECLCLFIKNINL